MKCRGNICTETRANDFIELGTVIARRSRSSGDYDNNGRIPPMPPFLPGDRIVCTEPCYDFAHGDTCTVYSMFLSVQKHCWFVRTIENATSAACSHFTLDSSFYRSEI